jgi:CHAD domain-containing protein
LDRPEREFDNRGESQNGETVVVQPAVEQVHEIEQQLAHDLEHAEVHHLRFIVRELREAMVEFRACIDFETRVVCLTGLQLKSGHPKRSLDGR